MSSTVPPQPRQEVRAFWTGPSLSLYEELSLRSFLASGARVQLFSYDDDLVVPDGVEFINANEILPGPVYAFRRAAGDKSLALHSDLFRYVAVEKYGGWYVDVDIIFIGRELSASPVYIARETAKVINGAVMKFPAPSPLLQRAIAEARRLLPETAASTSHEARLSIVDDPAAERVLAGACRAAEIQGLRNRLRRNPGILRSCIMRTPAGAGGRQRFHPSLERSLALDPNSQELRATRG